MILHIDMDAFFASIEQAINPKLKDRPLIVGSRGNRMHTVVCAASYEAKACGIHSGMPSKRAFQLCPDLEFITADQSKYIWTSEEVFRMLKAYNFNLKYASIDEFQMDIGDEPNPQDLAQKIRSQIQETFRITASIGIAQNWILAKLASKINKPNGMLVLNEDNLTQVLAKVPVTKLCGMGGKMGKEFSCLGILTCLDLYKRPAQFLEKKLGKFGLSLYASLHEIGSFFDELDSEDNAQPKSIGHSYTLPRPSENRGFIRAWIRLLADMVARRLREQNLTANTVHLWLGLPDLGNLGAQKTLQQPINDGYEIYQVSLKIMAKLAPKSPKIRAIGVTVSNLSANHYDCLLREEAKRQAVIKAIDNINNRYGDDSIYPAVITITRKMQ